MPRKTDINWEVIEQDFFASGDSPATVARRHGVSARSIQLKAKQFGWTEARQAVKDKIQVEKIEKIIEIPVFVKLDEDPLEVVDQAIQSMRMQLVGRADPRGGPAAAMALVKLLQYRDQLSPPTVEKLVARAIDLGITPDTFMAELRKQWSLVSTNSN